MIRAVRTRLGILTVLAAGSLALGCGSDGGGKGGAGGGGGSNKGLPDGDATLSLTFSPMYSAYIGPEHPCQVPVVGVVEAGRMEFWALDESIVDVERTGDLSAMLTMKKAGSTTIIGKLDDGSWGKAELHVTAATEADWELGQMRYENGVEAFMAPEGGFMPPDFSDSGIQFVDGSIVIPEGGFRFDGGGMFMANPESACTYCHKPDGAGSGGGGGLLSNLDVEHTPMQIGGYSDEELIKIFTEGTKPEGVPMRIATGRLAENWKTTHQWQMEEEAKKGIVAYIRSLGPKPQGEVVDFLGGLLRGDGGFMLPPGLAGLLEGGIGSFFQDGGFVIPPGLLGDGGFTFGGGGGGASGGGTSTGETDAGEETGETDAGEEMDAGAGS